RTVVADAIAGFGRVADVRRGPADPGALHIDGTGGARPAARLRHVAETGGRAARGRRRREAVGRAVVADAVAGLGDVAVAARRAAFGRPLRVRRAGGVVAGALLRDVAVAGRRAARGARRQERIRQAGVVHAVAALRHVAISGCSAALGGALRVGRAGRIRAG